MFDTAVTASQSRGGVRGKLAALPAAVAVHVVALACLVAGQLWAVGSVPEPAQTVSFVVFNPPPPPPSPPSGRASRDPGATGTRAEGHPPPVLVPETPPGRAASTGPDDGGTPGGVPGGVPDGVPGGVPGGVPDRADPPRREPVYRLDLTMVPPEPLARTAPLYPEVARRLRREGVVVLEAVIDRAGNVVDARVLRDPGFGMAEAALVAVHTWRYRPATLEGRPVSVLLTVTVTFQLH